MPPFNVEAVSRIRTAVLKSEGTSTPPASPTRPSPSDLMWLKLIEDFGTETEDMAGANPGIWSTDDPDDNGSYIADVVTIYDVRDPHGDCGAATGDWVLCSPLGTANGIVWEVLAVPGVEEAKHWGTLDAALAYDDSVGVAVSLDIGGTIDNVLPSKTQSDTIPISSAVLIELIDGDWYVTLAPC